MKDYVDVACHTYNTHTCIDMMGSTCLYTIHSRPASYYILLKNMYSLILQIMSTCTISDRMSMARKWIRKKVLLLSQSYRACMGNPKMWINIYCMFVQLSMAYLDTMKVPHVTIKVIVQLSWFTC